MKAFLPLYAIISLSSLLQAQTTWVVDQNGGGNFIDIQSAINASANGDTISVEPGTYIEDIDFTNKAISIISTGGSVLTKIEAPASSTNDMILASGNFTFDGFAISGNNSVPDCGILLPQYATYSVTITNCVFTEVRAAINIAGFSDGSVSIANCVFTEVVTAIASAFLVGALEIVECEFYKNATDISIEVTAGPIAIRQSTFQESASCLSVNVILGAAAGGVTLMEVDQCSFDNNNSFYASLIGVSDVDELNLIDCSFQSNYNAYGAVIGASEIDELNLIDCSFQSNYNVHGSMIYLSAETQVVSGCLFTNNNSRGSLIYAESPLWQGTPASSVKRCLFIDNYSEQSIIEAANIETTVNSCTFTFNTTQNKRILDTNNQFEIKSSIFWNNYSAINNSNLFGPFYPGADLSYSCIQDMSQYGIAGIGCIDSDPMFTSQVSYDFSLLLNSPCIDAGDPNGSAEPDGTIPDMGAIYFDQSGSIPNYTITNLIAGQYADFYISQAGVNLPVIIGYSLTGPGPTTTSYGVLDMSPPIQTLVALQSDASGNVSFSPLVPPGASGITLYTQALCGGILSNSLAQTTQ
jgi:hypothetical protein